MLVATSLLPSTGISDSLGDYDSIPIISSVGRGLSAECKTHRVLMTVGRGWHEEMIIVVVFILLKNILSFLFVLLFVFFVKV